MARNGSGVYSVPNPIVVGAIRSSTAVNTNFSQMGTAITDSVAVDGQSTMSGQCRLMDGSLVQPGLTFATDTNLGFYRSAEDELAWVSGGAARAVWDNAGKLTLNGALAVSATVSILNAPIPTGGISLRRIENDATEHILAAFASGSGAGAQASLRETGGGANDIATMHFYVASAQAFAWTGVLFTHSIDATVANKTTLSTAGHVTLASITAAAAPAANAIRVYSRGGLAYHVDSTGAETPFAEVSDNQVFTASGTWTKPAGRTMALVEVWGGGASGGCGWPFSGGGGGGGGGGYKRRIIALASLSASVAVTIGAGGAKILLALSDGNPGGNSSFGSYLTAYGGGGGCGAASARNNGGGGGGSTGVGTTDNGGAGTATGGPLRGYLGTDAWGESGGVVPNSNPFGGGSGGDDDVGGTGLYGGAGGGQGQNGTNVGYGGNAVYGGAGGGGWGNGVGASPGGTSVHGGNGGDGEQDGTAPGGGGGGSLSSSIVGSGAGARGEVRVRCW